MTASRPIRTLMSAVHERSMVPLTAWWGGTLRYRFEIGGRAFGFLAYSSALRDPWGGYVMAEEIRLSFGDFKGSARPIRRTGGRG